MNLRLQALVFRFGKLAEVFSGSGDAHSLGLKFQAVALLAASGADIGACNQSAQGECAAVGQRLFHLRELFTHRAAHRFAFSQAFIQAVRNVHLPEG